jgi:hypothetical protein
VTQGFLKAVRRAEPSFSPKLIFDVGANVGQSAELFLSAFPEARIQCFEPAEGTFAALSERFGADPGSRSTGSRWTTGTTRCGS